MQRISVLLIIIIIPLANSNSQFFRFDVCTLLAMIVNYIIEICWQSYENHKPSKFHKPLSLRENCRLEININLVHESNKCRLFQPLALTTG